MSSQTEIDALLVSLTTDGDIDGLNQALNAGYKPSEDADDLVTIAATLTDVEGVRYGILRVLVNYGLPEPTES